MPEPTWYRLFANLLLVSVCAYLAVLVGVLFFGFEAWRYVKPIACSGLLIGVLLVIILARKNG